MGQRQHRCPYYLLKISKDDIDNIKSLKLNQKNDFDAFNRQINSLTQKCLSLQSSIKKIMDILHPYYKSEEPLSLEECVNKSFLNTKTKSSTFSLIKKHKKFCNENTQSEVINSKGVSNPEDITSIYNPINAYNFIVNDNKYRRSSVKKNLNTLIRYISLATNNPYLKYNLPLGLGESVKLKHIITDDEIKRFVHFLNSKKLYILIVMSMLMFKFGVRIGSLAKLKVCDLLPDAIIIFRAKIIKL